MTKNQITGSLNQTAHNCKHQKEFFMNLNKRSSENIQVASGEFMKIEETGTGILQCGLPVK